VSRLARLASFLLAFATVTVLLAYAGVGLYAMVTLALLEEEGGFMYSASASAPHGTQPRKEPLP